MKRINLLHLTLQNLLKLTANIIQRPFCIIYMINLFTYKTNLFSFILEDDKFRYCLLSLFTSILESSNAFLWRLLHGYLATNDTLCSRDFYMVCQCICGRVVENTRHLFLDCPRVRSIWAHFWQNLGMQHVVFLTPHALLCYWR